MPDPDPERLVGDDRCWPCTVANGVVAVVIAGVPVVAGVLRGESTVLAATGVWAIAVLGYTWHRLRSRGYLPGSGSIAKRTGLHERIGPGRSTDGEPGEDSSDRDERD